MIHLGVTKFLNGKTLSSRYTFPGGLGSALSAGDILTEQICSCQSEKAMMRKTEAISGQKKRRTGTAFPIRQYKVEVFLMQEHLHYNTKREYLQI